MARRGEGERERRMDARTAGIRFFLWHASRWHAASIPYLCGDVRRLIWDACFPIVWMRCRTCLDAVLVLTREGHLATSRPYFVLSGRAVCDRCHFD